jgi:hypothetical protein
MIYLVGKPFELPAVLVVELWQSELLFLEVLPALLLGSEFADFQFRHCLRLPVWHGSASRQAGPRPSAAFCDAEAPTGRRDTDPSGDVPGVVSSI